MPEANYSNDKYLNQSVCPPGFHRMDNGTCMPGHIHPKINKKQMEQYHALLSVTEKHNQYNKSYRSNGSHYINSYNNSFKSRGMKCKNCIFFYTNKCQIVSGHINENALCKFWIIPDNKLK